MNQTTKTATYVSRGEPAGRAGDGHGLLRSIHHCADEPSPPARIVELRRDRGGPTATHVASRTSADNILCIANRFWGLVPLRRDQKLLPHFGEVSTAVSAVKHVEYVVDLP
jgi:hypothetical protein